MHVLVLVLRACALASCTLLAVHVLVLAVLYRLSAVHGSHYHRHGVDGAAVSGMYRAALHDVEA
jgi:hypothetical protein